MNRSDPPPLIAGFGSALMDILAHEDDDFVKRAGAAKGGMLLRELADIEQILLGSSRPPAIVPGGSACNTIVGVARLGGRARFIGKRGDDDYGRRYEQGIRESGVEPMLLVGKAPTGRSLSIITPDAERSMLTFLGAAADTRIDEIQPAQFQDAAIVLIEGYQLFNRELMLRLLEVARPQTRRIALDLSSYTVVNAARDIIDDITARYVDILIANEEEAFAFTGLEDEAAALEALAAKAEYAILKVGRRGSHIAHGDTRIHVPPMGDGRAIDTTGAGDLWAAGFLFGLMNHYPLDICGRLASACGFEVCQVVGAAIPAAGWQRIKALLPL